MDTPRNRKQRRAAAANSEPTELGIPLAQPNRDRQPETRTLYDIIAERQGELMGQAESTAAAKGLKVGNRLPDAVKGARFVTVDESGDLVDTEEDISFTTKPEKRKTGRKIHDEGATSSTSAKEKEIIDQPLPPLVDTVLLSFPLTTLHLTLAYLAAYQYAEETNVPRLIRDAVIFTFPLLTLIVHFFHGHLISIRIPGNWGFLNAPPVSIIPLTADKFSFSFLWRLLFPPTIRTLVYLPIAALLGAYLIAITNGEPYYAVMRKAPAYGTMWVWCILEMSFGPAVLGSIGPLVWGVFYMGYGIF
ncbi:hypothetical protein N7495_005141 [Penicillium taxi]|uniref:uncharacterized protein n=1 Tax=Penicillium taxi TaxID=168475 RepID=UPI00254528C5|nr:uncharacterized protein N7495_005141 [Penicillium taxi]KAJ5893450.1 hypothetical protein N7495_005141 [Penicillium taxi]